MNPTDVKVKFIIEVVVRLSLWSAIKMRIAGSKALNDLVERCSSIAKTTTNAE